MIMIFFSSCVLMTFVCNDRMSDTVDQMVDTSKGILNEAIFFINRTVGVRKIQLNLNYWDLSYQDFLITRTCFSGPSFSWILISHILCLQQNFFPSNQFIMWWNSSANWICFNCFKAQFCVHFMLTQAKAIYMNPFHPKGFPIDE